MVKLQIAAGKATPAPPVGTALGPHGVNIMDFCKNFNAKTTKDEGLIIPVVVTVYADRSYSFITKTPPASILLKRAANLAKGSAEPNKNKVGTVTKKQVEDIAKLKMPDLNASRWKPRTRPSPAPRARWASTSSDSAADSFEDLEVRQIADQAAGCRQRPERSEGCKRWGGPQANKKSGRPQRPLAPQEVRHAKNRQEVRCRPAAGPDRPHTIEEAIPLMQKVKFAKFDETVEIALRLGVDPKHADQMVRGTVVLPHGLGKSKNVLAIAGAEKQKEATEAGADFVGGEELVDKIQGGWMDFDAVVATPDMMRAVGKLGKVLGPRGLMPNPKTGTVTPNIAQAVREIKAGKVEFRVDKTGIVHAPVGKISFPSQSLIENTHALVDSVVKAKPSAAKGKFSQRDDVVDDGPGDRDRYDPRN